VKHWQQQRCLHCHAKAAASSSVCEAGALSLEKCKSLPSNMLGNMMQINTYSWHHGKVLLSPFRLWHPTAQAFVQPCNTTPEARLFSCDRHSRHTNVLTHQSSCGSTVNCFITWTAGYASW
jgi:hypothetical protein